LIIVAAGICAYWNSFDGVMLFDDKSHIIDNKYIRQLWPVWETAKLSTEPLYVSTRPLVQFTFALNYAIGGLKPWGYHAVNIAIHILAGLTLFGIIRRTLELEWLRHKFKFSGSYLAFSIALLWVVHPLQIQSVTYIIQRGESMMGLFYLLTLYCLIRGATGENGRLWYVTGITTCMLGMASKPVMVTAPVVILIFDRLFLSQTLREVMRRRWIFYLGLAASWIILAILLNLPNESSKTASFCNSPEIIFSPIFLNKQYPHIITSVITAASERYIRCSKAKSLTGMKLDVGARMRKNQILKNVHPL